ncbi:hypothetical protein A1O3_07160 [Capronia epimyces CBS 606.96]|uniref:Uncharacterized protein n=1 Tax=Capronia epimyces CBS 606.96 TaxID=1182542 RepID=W9XL22_9EURO|nr:uncharacterized protein A1O3_07160 [Capronia epimyces CBS 606.96]EXJ80873.1 hypothetical protein A1O3_07160 [Capronia epimyces CBS 606.96]
MILQDLLICTPFVDLFPRTRNLYPEILRCNKQLYAEGLDVLYGQNYFWIKIGHRIPHLFTTPASVYSTDYRNQIIDDFDVIIPRYKLIRNYEIYVEIKDGSNWERGQVRSLVRKMATTLSDVTYLKHLRITLGGHEDYYSEPLNKEIYALSDTLEPFTLLRRVHRVDMNGGVQPPPFSRYGFWDKLQDAYKAMDCHEVDQFKKIRADLVQSLLEDSKHKWKHLKYLMEHLKHKSEHLFDHDAEQDEQAGWIEHLSKQDGLSRMSNQDELLSSMSNQEGLLSRTSNQDGYWAGLGSWEGKT